MAQGYDEVGEEFINELKMEGESEVDEGKESGVDKEVKNRKSKLTLA